MRLSPKDTERKFTVKQISQTRKEALKNIQQDRRYEVLYKARDNADANSTMRKRDEQLQQEIQADYDYEAMLAAAEGELN